MKKIQRHTYRFNPHTLRYEKVLVTLRDRVKRISFSVLFGVVLGVVVVVVTLQFMEAPRERALRREVAQYKRQLRVLGDRANNSKSAGMIQTSQRIPSWAIGVCSSRSFIK